MAAFTYYAAQGGNDPYHMPLNAFTSFLDDCAIPDPDSASIKRSDCDTIFIVANFISDKKRCAASGRAEMRQGHACVRGSSACAA